MESQTDEINLIDLWKVIVKRCYLIIGFPIGFGILALVISLFLPKVYEGEAVVTIPSGTKGPLMNNIEIETIINVLLGELKKGNLIGTIDSNSAKKIVDVKIEIITSSDSKLKLIVQVKDEPQVGYEVLNKVVEYLKRNEFVLQKLDNKKESILAQKEETERTLERAIKIRDETLRLLAQKGPIGFNPIELETKISDLRLAMLQLNYDLNLIQGFEFVTKPYVYKNSVKPKVLVNVISSVIFSFFMVLFLVFIMESLNKDRSSKINKV